MIVSSFVLCRFNRFGFCFPACGVFAVMIKNRNLHTINSTVRYLLLNIAVSVESICLFFFPFSHIYYATNQNVWQHIAASCYTKFPQIKYMDGLARLYYKHTALTQNSCPQIIRDCRYFMFCVILFMQEMVLWVRSF